MMVTDVSLKHWDMVTPLNYDRKYILLVVPEKWIKAHSQNILLSA